jgi:hypothetical protein
MKKPLQIYVEQADLERLDAWSRARGWTKADAIRAAIRALTRSPDEDPLLSASALLHGLPGDVSMQFDRYLEDTFRAKTQRRPRQRRTQKPLRR